MFSKDLDSFFTESDTPIYRVEMDRNAGEGACVKCTNCMELCRKLGAATLSVSAEGTSKTTELRKCVSDGMCLLACPTRRVFTRGKLVQGNQPY